MRIANQVGAGARSGAIRNTSVVGRKRDAEWEACLGYGDARNLPTTEQLILKSAALEKRQAIHVADREVMAQVEIRTGTICGNVVSIDEGVIGAVRGIVNGVAVGIGKAY